MEELMKNLPFFIPLVVLQIGLMVYSLVDLYRRKKVRFNNKFIWVLIILCFTLFGSIVYLLARGEDE